MKTYEVSFTMIPGSEIVEANSKSDACEEVMNMILDNIGWYIDCEAEEIEEEEEGEEDED